MRLLRRAIQAGKLRSPPQAYEADLKASVPVHPAITAHGSQSQDLRSPCRRGSCWLKWFAHPHSGKLRSISQTMNSPLTSSLGRPSFGGRRGNQALCQGGCACSRRAASHRTSPLPCTAGAPEKRLSPLQNKRIRSATSGRATNRWPGGARSIGQNPYRAGSTPEELVLRKATRIFAPACTRRGWVHANSKAHRRSEPRSAQQAALAERHAQCTHNPSLNLTRYGRPSWPGWRHSVHFRQPGQAALP